MPSVKSTRLRRSGIRKMLRNFSSILVIPLQAPEAPFESCNQTMLRRFPFFEADQSRKVPTVRRVTRSRIGHEDAILRVCYKTYAAAGAASPPTTTALPPAFSIFSAADFENLCA